MRAAQVAYKDLNTMESEERVQQEKHIQDLIAAANLEQARLDPSYVGFESPHLEDEDQRTASGREQAEHSSSPHGSGGGQSAHSHTPPSWRERTRSPAPSVRVELAARLEPRVPRSENDDMLHLDRLAQSALVEEEGPIVRACFGPRIREELFPTGFNLLWDTPKYNGAAKLKDWVIDYTIAVGIARGNKRVAVRYVPLMLTGSAWTWLNSLSTGSINVWVDFEEAFVRNFTGTYKRPDRPRELAMCVQAAEENLHNYLTGWTKLRNSCEAVHKVQAIQYFIEGCRDGTLLTHKLMCSEPATLAELMAKAYKYATADSAMRIKVTTTSKAADNRGEQNNKRNPDQPDLRYRSK
ncbi:Endoglucanase 3 [Hordeum vulgare]|nr:Endoglucanase 3 [Hordeum vulgare]